MKTCMTQLNYSTVILQPLDDAVFLQRSASGSTTLPTDGHIRGELKIADREAVTAILKMCDPILSAAAGKTILIITPLPRYIGRSCCEDESHCTNRSRVDFYTTIREGLAMVRDTVSEYLIKNNHKGRVVDPVLSTKVMTVEEIWGDNKIAPLPQVFERIADSIKKVEITCLGSGTKRKADDQLTDPSRSGSDPAARTHIGPNSGPSGHHGGHRGRRSDLTTNSGERGQWMQPWSGPYRGHNHGRGRGRGRGYWGSGTW